jgi:hypothetical protein
MLRRIRHWFRRRRARHSSLTATAATERARLIVRISTALECYEQGDALAALSALQHVPSESPDITQAREWVELARDRLLQELGEDVAAVTPVPLALRSALNCLTEDATS